MSLSRKLRNWQLMPAEKSMLMVSLVAGTIAVTSFVWEGANVDWLSYGRHLLVVLAMLLTGHFYRASGRSERVGAAATCAGLFVFFTICLSIFNYMLLPLWRAPIDLQLNQIDQIFGYHWPSVIEWAGQHPVINNILRIAYASTLPQFAFLVVILGLSGRINELHVLIASVTITATFTICFWGLFPSFGTTVLYDLPQAMEMLAAPIASTLYGDELLRMATEGPGFITPKDTKGLIAFPSYHIVLAVTAIYASRTLKWVFPVYLVLNTLIMPGIFLHGGHHFVDLPAGLFVAVAGLFLARKIVYQQYDKLKLPEFVEA
jgi:hypothetical protein